jgi:hypothetical protein
MGRVSGHKEMFWDCENFLYLDLGGTYAGVFIYKISLSFILQIVHFFCMQIEHNQGKNWSRNNPDSRNYLTCYI